MVTGREIEPAPERIKPDKVIMPPRIYPWQRAIYDGIMQRRRHVVIDTTATEINRGRVEVRTNVVDTSQLEDALQRIATQMIDDHLWARVESKFRREHFARWTGGLD